VGFRRIDMRDAPPELLLAIDFTARVAVRSADSHYEVTMSNPRDPANPRCMPPGGGSFGPTESDLRAGERVRYTTFVTVSCPGLTHIRVSYVTVDGPSGDMPVPGLPGESGEIPVGSSTYRIP
jgi:hypothetical protein